MNLPPTSLHNANESNSSPTADITRRFELVLETTRAAGFDDFDEMAVTYYTTRFKKGSLPFMAQCASRSRRLRSLLQNIHENSNQWPRQESRGLHESISEASCELTVSIGSDLRPELTFILQHIFAWKSCDTFPCPDLLMHTQASRSTLSIHSNGYSTSLVLAYRVTKKAIQVVQKIRSSLNL
jgi:hypothetical protein